MDGNGGDQLTDFELLVLEDCSEPGNPYPLSGVVWEARRFLLGARWDELHWETLPDGQQVPVVPPVDDTQLRALTLRTLRGLLERRWIEAFAPGEPFDPGRADADYWTSPAITPLMTRIESTWEVAADHGRASARDWYFTLTPEGERALRALMAAGGTTTGSTRASSGLA